MFAMIIACAVFSYSLSMVWLAIISIQIGKSLADFSEEGTETRKNMQAINKYLKNKKITLDLQIKVKKYLDYAWNLPNQNSVI